MCFCPLSSRICTNSSSWNENLLTLEALPDFLSENLQKVDDVLTQTENHSNGLTMDILMGSTIDISRKTEMMKFLRNAILLCLTAFPRNYILEEAALVAEELSSTIMNSCGSSVTPCRALAKGLLKSDRQVVFLQIKWLKAIVLIKSNLIMIFFFAILPFKVCVLRTIHIW